jgi:hypothetical protein
MSRTTLTVLTATALTLLSLGAIVTRYRVLGDEARSPVGPCSWKVTMAVQGSAGPNARIITSSPLDVGHQHVVREVYASAQMQNKPPENRHPERRQVSWVPHGGQAGGPIRLRCEHHVAVDVLHPTPSMTRQAHHLYAPPAPGEHLEKEAHTNTQSEEISAQARHLTDGLANATDVAQALYQFVEHDIHDDPTLDGSTVRPTECLKTGRGDCQAKSRLLIALLRNRGIPARLVAGVTLAKGPRQPAHYWVEAWVHNRWLSMCPFYHHFGRVPSTYLILAFGDAPLVRGRHVKDLAFAFLVERDVPQLQDGAVVSPWRRFFLAISLYMLPPAEQHLVEFLLLLPVAALIICIYRNLIGLQSFGTFAPALVGLAFRDLHSLPGIFIFVSILLIGWLMRRLLDSYHLLQVPRVALMLSLIVVVLILAVVGANFHEMPATQYISLFPLIILTGMVERFWTLETEDSTLASFKTLLITMLIAATISVVLSLHAIVRHLFAYPETLGIIMAAQLLIGRYTGYRLMELFRFRDFLTQPA